MNRPTFEPLEAQFLFFTATGELWDIFAYWGPTPSREFKKMVLRRLREGFRVQIRYCDYVRIPCL